MWKIHYIGVPSHPAEAGTEFAVGICSSTVSTVQSRLKGKSAGYQMSNTSAKTEHALDQLWCH